MQVWFQLVKRGGKKNTRETDWLQFNDSRFNKEKMTRPELEPTTSEETAPYQLRRI